MNTILIILFVLCVLGFSISTVMSPTAQTFLLDSNPKIRNCNLVLFGFAGVLANYIRFPLVDMPSIAVWAVNWFLCLGIGTLLFVTVFLARAFYRYWRGEMCV